MVAQYSPVLLPLDNGKDLAQVGEGLAGWTHKEFLQSREGHGGDHAT